MGTAPRTLKIQGIQAENLRGYQMVSLPIGRFTALVGNNNEGKSSLLKLAEWLLNSADDTVLLGERSLSDNERQLLLPANKASGKARRLTLQVRFDDARCGRTYGQTWSSPALLRMSVHKAKSTVRLNVGPPQMSESGTDRKSLHLLRLVRESVEFVLVPSARDARSERFRAALEMRLRHLILDRFEHRKRAGAPGEYRRAKNMLRVLRNMVESAKGQLWAELQRQLPPGLLRDVALRFDPDPSELANWIRDKTVLALSTGTHDEELVAPHEVGNGLQSALDVALTLASLSDGKRQVIAAIEEPEAFLHPAAQRGVALNLRGLADSGKADVVLTTHSPYFVDEARYGDVVLVRDHRYYAPAVLIPKRDAINSALMSTRSAEVFFASGVLLVEGPGDVALFEALRRRIQRVTQNTYLSRLAVVDVGGKRSFAPWWQLLASYGATHDRPIQWLSILDGDAAAGEGGDRAVLRAAKDAGLAIDEAGTQRIVEFGDHSFDDTAGRLAKCSEANNVLESVRVRLFSVDCEWAAFGGWSEHCPHLVAKVLGCDVPDQDVAKTLARRAGSKAGSGKQSSGAAKAPHLRQQLGNEAPLEHMPGEIKSVMSAWIALVTDSVEADELLARACHVPADSAAA